MKLYSDQQHYVHVCTRMYTYVHVYTLYMYMYYKANQQVGHKVSQCDVHVSVIFVAFPLQYNLSVLWSVFCRWTHDVGN